MPATAAPWVSQRWCGSRRHPTNTHEQPSTRNPGCNAALGLEQPFHAKAGFVGQLHMQIYGVVLDLRGMLPRLVVKMKEILAESPAQTAHADMHPQINALPPG